MAVVSFGPDELEPGRGSARLTGMKNVLVFILMVLSCGCSSEVEPDRAQPPTTAATWAATTAPSGGLAIESIGPLTTTVVGSPPIVVSETGSEPVPLPVLGSNVWLIGDWGQPDLVVRTDGAGTIVETLWEEDLEVVGSLDAGHALVCDDIDLDGEVDLVDLRFSFVGDLRNVYQESRSVDGQVISEVSRSVDGTSVPDEVHEICGQTSAGPYIRLTARQWGAALRLAGFTEIAGDHAIDPVWEAGATWAGVEYWGLNLYQGDFRPEPDEGTVLTECDLGGIEHPQDLPSDARSALFDVSGC